MRLHHILLLSSILLLCSCGDDDASNDSNALTNAQVGSVAQSITSLTESAVQNEIANEGETVATVVAKRSVISLPSLGLMGNYGSGYNGTNSFVFNGVNIDFINAASFNVAVDLDGAEYPNASGTLNINATTTGPTGTQSNGSISFDTITVTTADSVTVTDPNSGAKATWPDGTTFNYSVSITWTHTDSDNWSYTTTTTSTATNRSVTVSGKGGSYSGNVDHDFTWARTISRTGGAAVNVSLDTFSGTRDVVWTKNGSSKVHTVNWVINSLNDIQVTVNGFTFNFNSVLALVALLNANLNHDG